MSRECRIIVQYKNESGRYRNDERIDLGEVKNPTNIMDLGLRHIEQVEILKKIQDSILRKHKYFVSY